MEGPTAAWHEILQFSVYELAFAREAFTSRKFLEVNQGRQLVPVPYSHLKVLVSVRAVETPHRHFKCISHKVHK